MAIPAYTTDLILFRDFESAVTLSEFANFISGRGQALDTDYPIQGLTMVSTIQNSTGNASCAVDFGSNIVWTSGWNMFMWKIWLAPSTIGTRAAGGLVFIIGSDVNNFREWNTAGSDYGSYPYGGWQNFAVNPEVAPSITTGVPGTAYRWVGPGVRVLSAVAKGSPLGVDVIRYGRGEIRIAGGETASLANFSGVALFNDNNNNRLGLFQQIDGGYKMKGLMTFGFGTLTQFTDSNKSIVIEDSLFVLSTFNRIEVRNIASIVNWSNITITSLATVSKGAFQVIDNATVVQNSCTFIDMTTFGYLSNSTITSTTFRRCALITQGGSILSKCVIINSPAPIAVTTTTPNRITDCLFTSVGTGHGVQITLAGTYSFSGNSFTGYAATNGSTGNEAIFNNSGGQVTLNVTGGTVPTFRNGTASTTTIVSSVSITVTGLRDNTEVRVYSTGTTTELAGIETVTSGTVDNRFFTFSLTAGLVVDITVVSVTYENERIVGYIIPSLASSIPVQQRFDRNYSNPV
jgi:hypothetical protein